MSSRRSTPLGPPLGAEVAGVGWSAPIVQATRQALTHALAEHLVLLFRHQALTSVQYLAAAYDRSQSRGLWRISSRATGPFSSAR